MPQSVGNRLPGSLRIRHPPDIADLGRAHPIGDGHGHRRMSGAGADFIRHVLHRVGAQRIGLHHIANGAFHPLLKTFRGILGHMDGGGLGAHGDQLLHGVDQLPVFRGGNHIILVRLPLLLVGCHRLVASVGPVTAGQQRGYRQRQDHQPSLHRRLPYSACLEYREKPSPSTWWASCRMMKALGSWAMTSSFSSAICCFFTAVSTTLVSRLL